MSRRNSNPNSGPSPTRTPFRRVSVGSAQSNVNTADDLVPMINQNLQISTKEKEKVVKQVAPVTLYPASGGNPKIDSEIIDWEKERQGMDEEFEKMAESQLKDLPRFNKPKQFKKETDLLPYQKEGVRWLVNQERNPDRNPFFSERILADGGRAYYDKIVRPNSRIPKPYAPVPGAILADDMGLGKTLQALGLILCNPPAGHTYGAATGSHANEPVCTLVVCPKSVLSNWQEQVQKFIKPGALRVEVYSGNRKQRAKMIPEITSNQVDVLLITYETLAAELDKLVNKRGHVYPDIHDAKFYRVILDEAQHIRNPQTKNYRAAVAVAKKSQYLLALTGTPFVNNPRDIQSLFAFVGLEPLNNASNFEYSIGQPILERRRAGLSRLRTALKYVTLRRTKTAKDLTDKSIQICYVEFTEQDGNKKVHDCMYLTAKAVFEASINGASNFVGEGNGIERIPPQALFEMLLRVRQACASGALVPVERYRLAYHAMTKIVNADGSLKKLSVAEAKEAINFLQIGKSDSNLLDSMEARCNAQQLGPSPKILALLRVIDDMSRDEKGVIFSQWTSFLDLIEDSLAQRGHEVVRIDGSMNSESRTLAMQAFEDDDRVRFILCSLKAAGTGINLTRGNVVFMLDPWFNSAVETQAIDRCHRMGQTRPVRVYRFIMKGSIEERMISVQRAKETLGKGSLTHLNREEEKLAKVTAMKDLFQIESSANNASWGHEDVDEWY